MGKIMYRGEQFPGGPNLLSELRDINFSNVQDKQIILYDSTSRTWKNHTITAADVAYDENNSVEDAIDTLNSTLDSMCQNYTRLFSLASNNTWADVTVNDITQYRKLVFCLTRQAAGSTNISLTNPISVSVNFFKNTLNNGSNYLHIYTIKQDTNQLCEAAVYYVNDTTVKFYGAGPWNWELYGVK